MALDVAQSPFSGVYLASVPGNLGAKSTQGNIYANSFGVTFKLKTYFPLVEAMQIMNRIWQEHRINLV